MATGSLFILPLPHGLAVAGAMASCAVPASRPALLLRGGGASADATGRATASHLNGPAGAPVPRDVAQRHVETF